MANMSHCRFRNTLRDLEDCQEHLWDEEEELSLAEAEARKKIIEVCKEIVLDAEEEY